MLTFEQWFENFTVFLFVLLHVFDLFNLTVFYCVNIKHFIQFLNEKYILLLRTKLQRTLACGYFTDHLPLFIGYHPSSFLLCLVILNSFSIIDISTPILILVIFACVCFWFYSRQFCFIFILNVSPVSTIQFNFLKIEIDKLFMNKPS